MRTRFNNRSARMVRHGRWPISVAVVAALWVCGLYGFAQSLSIDWYTIDGGGGTSTGGVFAVSGTIGQPDAGPTMTGGPYAVTGGFWALCAVQTPGAPTLIIVPDAPGFARISWTPDTTGFVLQEALALTPPAWTNSPSGITNPVVVPAVPPTKYYRLHKPGG